MVVCDVVRNQNSLAYHPMRPSFKCLLKCHYFIFKWVSDTYVGAPANYVKEDRSLVECRLSFNKPHDNYLYWITVHDEPIRA